MLGGCLGLAVSQGDFLTGLSALGESSLKSRSKSKGQMASWPEAPPRKAGSQRSHGQPHQRLPFSLGEPLRARARGSQPGLPLGECLSFPFSHLGASGTLGKLRDFSNAKRKHISLHCIEWISVPSLYSSCRWRGLGPKGKDVLQNTIKEFFCT